MNRVRRVQKSEELADIQLPRGPSRTATDDTGRRSNGTDICEKVHHSLPRSLPWDQEMPDMDQPRDVCRKINSPVRWRSSTMTLPFLFFKNFQDSVELLFHLHISDHSLLLRLLIFHLVPPELEPGLTRNSV